MDEQSDWVVVPRVVAIDGGLGNADVVVPIAGAVLYSIKSLAFHLATSADVANRQVVVKLVDSLGVTVFAEAAPAVQAASLGVDYSFSPGVLPFGTASLGFMGGSFVGGRLPQNLSVVIHVGAGVVADVISKGRLLVHQLERGFADDE